MKFNESLLISLIQDEKVKEEFMKQKYEARHSFTYKEIDLPDKKFMATAEAQIHIITEIGKIRKDIDDIRIKVKDIDG